MRAATNFELCSYPSSLFEKTKIMRAATKSQRVEALWSGEGDVNKNFVFPEGDVDYVRDGGSHLHRIPWPPWFTYQHSCHHIGDKYLEYVK